MKIYVKHKETKVRMKKAAAEFGSYEKALIKFLNVYETNPELFRDPQFR